MNNHIHLTDNCIYGYPVNNENSIQDILDIAKIDNLEKAQDLLIFPNSFSEVQDLDKNLSILQTKELQNNSNGKCQSLTVFTGNLMGFVGKNRTSISIHSRFTSKTQQGEQDYNKDYFLYYMLEKVFSINVFTFDHSSNKEDKVLDFMLFLFPNMLKKAIGQGIYKEYRRYHYNDSRIKGAIDINKFIRYNIPFKGCVSYSTRQHSYDNPITQLIRHTIEYIKRSSLGNLILNNDRETSECVKQIIEATPSYNYRDLIKIMNLNLKPKIHPYFNKYGELQKLCIQILKHESLKYGEDEDKVYGILFDGAWLWEEYLNTILIKLNFKHPRNKEKTGGIRIFKKPESNESFSNNDKLCYPDFYRNNYVLDAKYKHLNSNVNREDLYQIISYMYCLDAAWGGFIYPSDNTSQNIVKYKLVGKGLKYDNDKGGIITIIPFHIPLVSENMDAFNNQISHIENELKINIKECL